MKFQESGVMPGSKRYLFTPSSFAEQVLFYPTRAGHFFCDKRYRFNNMSEIARQPGHRLHYMLFLIKKGAMELTLNTQHYVAEAGSAVLFDCKNSHEYHAVTEHLEFYWLVFDGITCPVYYEEILSLHNDHHVFPCANQDELEHYLKRLIKYYDQNEHVAEVQISELIYSMLCCTMLNRKSSNAAINILVDDAMHYMDSNFNKVLSVSAIADHVGLSSSYLTRCFRQQTGYSPHEYLTLRRIGFAKDRLLSTDKPVNEIALEAGYKSTENFIRAFKGAVGVSPSSFRRYMV